MAEERNSSFSQIDPTPVADIVTTAATRLQTFIRRHISGQCRILSEGDSCQCLLCDVSRLVEASGLTVDKKEAAG